MDQIMDDIRDTTFSEMNRQHLITKQDLHNIKAQFNIDGILKHKNDLTSVNIWIEELRKMNYNPVLVYKSQGEEQHDNICNIFKNDFLLCLQSEIQKDMLIKFGSNVICMDTTHGTNSYDFSLTSILVVGEFGEAVDWMISNRQDELINIEFLEAIKRRTGSIHPRWFMTDDAEQFFFSLESNIWRGGYNKVALHMAC